MTYFFYFYVAALVYLSLKGIGYLFGIGIRRRSKCWSSEEALSAEWKRKKDPRFKEYFA